MRAKILWESLLILFGLCSWTPISPTWPGSKLYPQQDHQPCLTASFDFPPISFCLTADRKEGGVGDLKYPLVSDLNKTISEDYGVLSGGVALRGLVSFFSLLISRVFAQTLGFATSSHWWGLRRAVWWRGAARPGESLKLEGWGW